MWFLKNIFKHGAFLPKQKHKSPNSFCLIRSPGPGRVRRLHKYHIWYFGPHFLNIGCWGCPSKANNTILGYSIEKSGNNIANIIKKSHNFVRKTKYYQKKNSKWPWEITSRFLRGRERRKAAGHVGVSCQDLDIHHLLQKITTILKENFHSTIEVFLKYMIVLELGKISVLMICLN